MRTPRRHPAAVLRLAALLAAAAAIACEPVGGTTTVTPGGGGGGTSPDPDGRTEGEGSGELKKRLDALVAREEALAPLAVSDAGRCEELCELATSICAVQEKLCDLADARPEDEAYQGLCREARNECREAQDSCVRCVENLQRSTAPAP